MNTDLSMQLLTPQLGRTQSLTQIAGEKQTRDSDISKVSIVHEAPPPAPKGQGTVVDKQA